jgi:uncharacterized iron-regulated membrane protein
VITQMWHRVALVLAAALAFGLLVLNVLAWSGAIVSEPVTQTQSEPPVEEPASPAVQRRAVPRPEPVARRTPSKPAAAATALAITATRGDCWVEVRIGSSAGRILYAGTLASGSTIKFNREKLWLRLGAASNVDLVVNGKPSEVPPGTVELSLPT